MQSWGSWKTKSMQSSTIEEDIRVIRISYQINNGFTSKPISTAIKWRFWHMRSPSCNANNSSKKLAVVSRESTNYH